MAKELPMKYNKKLKNPKWQKKRLKIMERDKFACVHCRDEETTLNVHHKKYTGEPWDAPDEDLETVCEDCHSIIEDIESMINATSFDCVKIIKLKNNTGFDVVYVLGERNGVSGMLSWNVNGNGVFLKKDVLENILNIMNNG